MNRFLPVFLIVIIGFSTFANADDIATDPAAVFVNNLSARFIDEIFESDKTQQEKVATFKDEFLKNADITFISKFVLGKAWKNASAENKELFTQSFSDSVVLSWAARFQEYNGQKIKVTNIRAANSGQMYVDSLVVDNKNPTNTPISLIWRLKNTDEGYKIVDLIIEGVSMVMTYRNEYAVVLQAKNGDIVELVKSLDIKNDKLEQDLKVKL